MSVWKFLLITSVFVCSTALAVNDPTADEITVNENTVNENTVKESTAEEITSKDDCARYYVFSWNMLDTCAMKPRGGTSKGESVELDKAISTEWLALQESGLTKFEKDRRAILAMQGPYKTSFEFLETIGYSNEFKPAAPYQSWGTEYVYVVEDRDDFISLQHIMVMFFATENGVQGPMVMKHWRQDWQYEKREILEYQSERHWQLTKFKKKQVEGTWSQSVYQVDDSPRYGSFGVWQHNAEFSQWKSELTNRPLPRRESSVRHDYDVLQGFNTHVILPNGWVQEEENFKITTQDKNETQYLAKELGVNRYQRIKNFDWREGDLYWEKTSAFWQAVRENFSSHMKADRGIRFKATVDDQPLFAVLFELAEEAATHDALTPAIEKRIATIVDSFVE